MTTDTLTDEEHDALHVMVENEILDTFDGVFGPDNYMCRAVLLLKLLHDEFMLMENSEDVSAIAHGISGILLKRACSDVALFNSMGNA